MAEPRRLGAGRLEGQTQPRRLIEPKGAEVGITTDATDRAIDLYRDRFLSAEEQATGRLMSFYAQARLELEDFLKVGDLTPADQSFYRGLQAEVERAVGTLDEGARKWIDSTIPAAFHEGAQTNLPSMEYTVLHDQAVKALSSETLDLIRQTSAGIRRAVQQQVATGILEGLSGAELRARISATGLQPGRWRSVEERAGVIARTETMRAYNGGAEAAQRESGALVCKWIVSPDEATCPICSTYAGKLYRLPGVTDADLEAAGAPIVPERPPLPRHPRCRCTSRAVFRGEDGKLFSNPQTGEPVAEVKPAEPAGGIADAAGTFEGALGRLKSQTPYDVEWARATNERRAAEAMHIAPHDQAAIAERQARIDRATEAQRAAKERTPSDPYWRSRDFTAQELSAIAADPAAFSNFLFERYGVRSYVQHAPAGFMGRTFEPVDLSKYPPELREKILSSIERWRSIDPAFVTDSDTFTLLSFEDATQGGTENWLASCNTSGRIIVGRDLVPYVEGQTLRASVDGVTVNAVEEVMVHELGHSVQNRYGPHGVVITPLLEADAAVIADWQAIVKKSQSYQDIPASAAQVKIRLDRVQAKYDATLAELQPFIDRLPEYLRPEPGDWATRETFQKWRDYVHLKADFDLVSEMSAIEFEMGIRVEMLRKVTDEYLTAGIKEKFAGSFGVEDYVPTEYAGKNMLEDWAESTMLYLLNPAYLARVSPSRYAFIRDRVMRGKEIPR